MDIFLAKPNEWDTFIDESMQNNIFSKTVFLKSLEIEFDYLLIKSHGLAYVGALVIKKGKYFIQAPHPYSLYQGVFISKHLSSLPIHSYYLRMAEAIEVLLKYLELRYDQISFCLHPTFPDIRQFSWFHYHQPATDKFRVDVFYTGLINIREFLTFGDYLKTIRKLRVREYNKGIAANLTVKSGTLPTFLDLYRKTFARQNESLLASTLDLVKQITISALDNGYGTLSACNDSRGNTLSASLFIHDKQTSYYLFGANHPDSRSSGSGTFLMLSQIENAFKEKKRYVDMVGVNSPNRGDYKISFNAKPLPYYVLNWIRTGRI